MSMRRVRGVTGAIAAVVVVAGCRDVSKTVDELLTNVEPVSHPRAQRFERGEIAVEWISRIDRYTYFGPVEGPNMLFTTSLGYRPKEVDYTFYGGCYTWVAPQGGPEGWINEFGEPLEWPPDPAMDTGPAQMTGRTRHSFTTTTPVSRKGLQEVKTLTLRWRKAWLDFELRNRSDERVTAACWVNTAVAPDSYIALRAPEWVELYGWSEESVEQLRTIMDPPNAEGWRLIRVPDAAWEGGIKVYTNGPGEIAVWRQGWWMHRRQMKDDAGRLRDHGEGPVAVYLQPDSFIFEAELYGPIVEIAPGGSHSTREEWKLVASPEPDVDALPAMDETMATEQDETDAEPGAEMEAEPKPMEPEEDAPSEEPELIEEYDGDPSGA